ncbi:MAG: hypothetical protein ACREOB_01160, partial [Thermodesulfobacteriota bacterium]
SVTAGQILAVLFVWLCMPRYLALLDCGGRGSTPVSVEISALDSLRMRVRTQQRIRASVCDLRKDYSRIKIPT